MKIPFGTKLCTERFSSLKSVLFLKAIYASAGIDELLLAREERVAFRADFNADILLRGTGLYDFTAGTTDCCFFVLRMDAFLHC